jgi:hypothetical protein
MSLQKDEEKLLQLKKDIQAYEKFELLIDSKESDQLNISELTQLSEEYKKS